MNKSLNILLTFAGVATLMAITVLSYALYVSAKDGEVRKDKVISIYTTRDLIHVNTDKLTVEFESVDSTLSFKYYAEMTAWVEEYTAQSATPLGSKESLEYYAGQGYLIAQVHKKLDKDGNEIDCVGKVDLYYTGPNFAYAPTRDTSVLLTTFDRVEEFVVQYEDSIGLHKVYDVYRID